MAAASKASLSTVPRWYSTTKNEPRRPRRHSGGAECDARRANGAGVAHGETV